MPDIIMSDTGNYLQIITPTQLQVRWYHVGCRERSGFINWHVIKMLTLLISNKIPHWYHIEVWTKWSPFCTKPYQKHFVIEKYCISVKIVLIFLYKGLINDKSTLVQVKDPNMQQVVTWVNADQDLWCYVASLDHKELMNSDAFVWLDDHFTGIRDEYPKKNYIHVYTVNYMMCLN